MKMPDETGGTAISEALALLPLLKRGARVDELRRLIEITPSEQRGLFMIEDEWTARQVVAQRVAILMAFDQLVRQMGADRRR